MCRLLADRIPDCQIALLDVVLEPIPYVFLILVLFMHLSDNR